MKSLFFIESPLQLLNACEAVEKYSITDYKIIARLSNMLQNDEQIKFVIDKLNIKNIEFITISTKDRRFKDYVKLFYYKYIYKIPKDIDTIFIGNYDSSFLNLIMKNVNKEKIILLDDGAKTIDIQKKFTDTKNYNLFTMYDLKTYKNQTIVKNDFTSLQSKIEKLNKNKNKILFLGLKLSEIGIVTEEYYVEQLIKIAQFYATKEIIYVSHRGESKTKLDKLNMFKNIQVVQLDYPVELYGLYNDEIPYNVASFYSTALLTMKNIYNIEAHSFRFDYSHSKYKIAIDNVYSYYEKYFEVKNLND